VLVLVLVLVLDPVSLPQFGGHLTNGGGCPMTRKKQVRKKYTQAFREEAVRLVQAGERPIAEVARQVAMDPATLWRWVRQGEVDAGAGKAGELTTSEKEELRRLRREIAQLREEREILKKATAFFAKENK
jgi:transposase